MLAQLVSRISSTHSAIVRSTSGLLSSSESVGAHRSRPAALAFGGVVPQPGDRGQKRHHRDSAADAEDDKAHGDHATIAFALLATDAVRLSQPRPNFGKVGRLR